MKNKSRWLVKQKRAEREAELDKLSKRVKRTDAKRLNTQVPRELYYQFKIKAASDRLSMTQVVLKLVQQYLEKEE